MTSTLEQIIKDIGRGAVGEKIVKEYLERKYGLKVEDKTNLQLSYDLEITGFDESRTSSKDYKRIIEKFGYRIEVKRDYTADRTGNYATEIWSNKPINNSGCVPKCVADTLAIVLENKIIFLNRAHFLAWIIDELYHSTATAEKWREKTTDTMNGTLRKLLSMMIQGNITNEEKRGKALGLLEKPGYKMVCAGWTKEHEENLDVRNILIPIEEHILKHNCVIEVAK